MPWPTPTPLGAPPQALTYKLAEGAAAEDIEEKDRYYLSDEYKRTVLQVLRGVMPAPGRRLHATAPMRRMPNDSMRAVTGCGPSRALPTPARLPARSARST